MLPAFLGLRPGEKEEAVAGNGASLQRESAPHDYRLARRETEAVYGSEIWEKRVSGGTKTFSEAYFDELRQFFYELSALNGMAEERNVKLDTEETRRLHEAAQRFYTESVQGQSGFGSLGEEEVEFMFQQYARALKLRKVMREDRKAEVSESEAKVIHLQNAVLESRETAGLSCAKKPWRATTSARLRGSTAGRMRRPKKLRAVNSRRNLSGSLLQWKTIP